jgi:hypothetical protein
MQALILPTLFLIGAAFFNAVSDTLADHFDTSVFRWLDPRFWNKQVSWRYAPFLKFTRYRLDAWHLSKSLSIICAVLAMVFHTPVFPWWAELAGAGLLWNETFNLFYDKILR